MEGGFSFREAAGFGDPNGGFGHRQKISLFSGRFSTRSALITPEAELKEKGGKKGGGEASEQE
jgi:hypothetical protein